MLQEHQYEPGSLYVPAGQVMQGSDPEVDLKVPGTQTVQLPGVPVFPAGHWFTQSSE